MKAMLINAYGEDAVFQAAEVEKPEVRAGHVLVNIAASSVNTVDTMIRKMGKELPLSPDAPAILGMDFAGTIEAVGEGVSNYSIGDEVYGCAGGLADLPGTLAEYIVADCNLIAHKPKILSMREAAALPLVGITACEGLTRAGIKQGQKVLELGEFMGTIITGIYEGIRGGLSGNQSHFSDAAGRAHQSWNDYFSDLVAQRYK